MATAARQQAFEALVALGQKVEAHVENVSARHPTRMHCGRGCHACCQPGLTVGPAEAARLRAHLSDPAVAGRVRALAESDPWRGTRCALLDADGACSVYEARPLVCRSHGVPQQVREEGETRRDACELNFTDVGLSTLDSRDVLDLDVVHTVLAVIHARFDAEGHDVRTPLTAQALVPTSRDT